MDDQLVRLEQGIEGFLADHREPAMSASRVIDDLLGVWGLAIEVDHSVAAPVETLLTALVGRELTSAAELDGTMLEVRAAAAASGHEDAADEASANA